MVAQCLVLLLADLEGGKGGGGLRGEIICVRISSLTKEEPVRNRNKNNRPRRDTD